jgi:hypothetical protein
MIDPQFSFNHWEALLWILVVDIFPTLAVVVSFRHY